MNLIPRTCVTFARFSSKLPTTSGGSPTVSDDSKKYLSREEKVALDKWNAKHDIEKFIIAMRLKGYENPLGAGRYKRKEVSTKDDPNIVSSFRTRRTIGCICEEEDCHIKWMRLHKNEVKRCFCGHWFKLVDAKLPDLSEFGIDTEAMEEMLRNM